MSGAMRNRWLLIGLSCPVLILSAMSCTSLTLTSRTPLPTEGIAILRTDSIGHAYIKQILESVGYEANFISAREIKRGILDNYDVLVVPGGVAPIIYGASQELKEEIRDFVGQGGGYIGVCGGAILATEGLYRGDDKVMDLAGIVDVRSRVHLSWADRYLISDVELGLSLSEHPINYPYGGEVRKIAYKAGPAMYKREGTTQEIEVIGVFNQDLDPDLPHHEVKGAAAIIAAKYENGKVVILSPHPEYMIGNDNRFFLINAVEWVTSK